MAAEIEYSESIRTPKYYIVEVERMREDEMTIKGEHGEDIILALPITRNNDTDGLMETGVVKSVPIGHSPDLIGKNIRFWFLNTDFTLKSGISIKGHVLVPEYDIIEVEGEMHADWIYCKPIEKMHGLIYVPVIQHISYDSMEKPVEEWGDKCIDKGIVARKNAHFPEGEKVFWGNPANVRQNWDDGFLVRTRYIQATGEDVSKMEWSKN
jgi:hypothetical protein